jgi:hypothetical protein
MYNPFTFDKDGTPPTGPFNYLQRSRQIKAPDAAPLYTPHRPRARENAYPPTVHSGFHPSMFPDVGTYSTGSGTSTPTPNASQSLLPQVNTKPAPTAALPSQQAPALRVRGGVALGAEKLFTPTRLPVRGGKALGSEKPPLPSHYEQPNIYGIPGITRFDDKSGVPTFTNTGRAGYDQLQGVGGGVQSPLPQQGASLPGAAYGGTLQGIESQRTANAGLYKARLAASMGLTEDQYDRVMAARLQEREISALGRQGFGTKEVAGLMAASANGKGTLYAARTQEALAKARKAEAEAAGGDPKAGYYGARGEKERALAQGAQLDNQAKQQLQQLQQLYLKETDPAKQKQLADMIYTIQTKIQNQQPEYRTIALAGGEDERLGKKPSVPFTYSTITGLPVQGALPSPQVPQENGVPKQDGIYEIPGVGRVRVSGGQAYDIKGNRIR